MNLLLDTHTFLWFVWDDPQLSPTARAGITNPGNRKLISTASCWEIAIKVSLQKLDLGEPYLDFMRREISINLFEILPISLEHASQLVVLPFHHRDPFDRALIAQAMWEQMVIVSVDTAFDAYAVKRIW
jgi:PIN domain nuclease of toxin-antitoxin system